MRTATLMLALLIPAAAARAGTPTRAQLDRAAIVRGMTAIRPQLRACAAGRADPVLAVLNLRIAPSGTVADAALEHGPLSGTDAGACLVRVARRAVFPRFDGAPMTLAYPVMLP